MKVNMSNGDSLTKTQRRLMNILEDGLYHDRSELFNCLNDELTELITLRVHIHNIRKKIRPLGQDISCESVYEASKRTCRYRLVRLVQG